VGITVEAEGEFTVMLRIPAWCEEGAAVEVNGEPIVAELSPGSYAKLHRTWRPSDTINMDLPMPVRRVESHPYVAENAERIALTRGPLLYCAEQIDSTRATSSWMAKSRPSTWSPTYSEAWLYCRLRLGPQRPAQGGKTVSIAPYVPTKGMRRRIPPG